MIEGAECQCGKKVVPFRKLCPVCGRTMSNVEFRDEGSVLTYTTLHATPEGFESPIRLAMVELKEGAHLICGVKDGKDFKIGDDVNVKKDGELYFCQLK